MYDVSAQWAPALATAHGAETRVDVYYDGDLAAADIPITGGSVTVDRGSAVRRTATVTVPGGDSFPDTATDPLAPYGTRLHIRQGLRYVSGEVEWVSLGRFVITGVSGDVHTGPLTLTAPGLEALCQQPWDVAASTSGYATAAAFIAARLAALAPDLPFVDTSTHGADPLPRLTYDAGGDQWADLRALAVALGAELYVDADGTARLVDLPDPSNPGAPVWDISAGANGILVSANKSLTREDVYNRVVVVGENATEGTAVWAESVLSDPTNPLRWDGPLGRRTKHIRSSAITTTLGAQTTANVVLPLVSAPNRSVSVSTVPNAALDAGDCFRVDYGGLRDADLYIAQRFSVPLGDDSGEFRIDAMGGNREVDV